MALRPTVTRSLQRDPSGVAAESSAIASAPKSLQELSETLAGKFSLGWTHYVALLTISNVDERRFYEIEAGENSWDVRELDRQISADRSAPHSHSTK